MSTIPKGDYPLDKVNGQAETVLTFGGPKRVTLCLAATCQYKEEPAVVLCCDMTGSRDDVVSESTDKMRRIKDSDVLLAGDFNAAKELLIVCERKIEKYEKGGDELAVSELLKSLREAVLTYRDNINTHYLGRTYGINFGEFKSRGKAIFYESDHSRILNELKSLNIGAGLIISSFSDDEAIHLTIGSDGHVAWVDNYAVQGTGARICNTFLAQRNWDDHMPLEECLYRVFEAKLAAEKDPYVGESIELMVVTPDQSYFVQDDYIYHAFQLIEERRTIPVSSLGFSDSFLKPANDDTV